MRLLHTADLHLGTPLGDHDRSAEHFAAVEWLVQTALEREVDAVLIAGDLFYERLGGAALSRTISGLVERLRPLLSAGIHLIVLRGNHDLREHFVMFESCLRFAAAATGDEERVRRLVQLVVDPSVIELPHGVQCVALPYPTTEWLLRLHRAAETGAAATAIASRNQRVSAAYAGIYRDLLATCDPARPVMVAGHFTAEGAMLPSSQEEGFQWAWDQDFLFPVAEWSAAQVRYVALGHVHQMHRLPGHLVPIWYSGPLERLNMGERTCEPGALLVTISPEAATRVEPVRYPGAALMQAIEGEADNLDAVIAQVSVEARSRTYVRAVVRRSSATEARTIQRALRGAFPRHVGLRVLVDDPTPAEDDRERATLRMEDFGGTILAHLRDVLRDDPHLERMMALADVEIGVVREQLTREEAEGVREAWRTTLETEEASDGAALPLPTDGAETAPDSGDWRVAPGDLPQAVSNDASAIAPTDAACDPVDLVA